MDRKHATQLLRDELDKAKLSDWKIRLNGNPTAPFLGLCSYRDQPNSSPGASA